MPHPVDDSSVASRVALRVRKSASILRRPSRIWLRQIEDHKAAPQTKLNYDVLYAVMKILESSRDLLSTMHTCRMLYQIGVSLLLTNIVYTHTRNRHLLYRHLLLADPTRFKHITTLACDYMDFPHANTTSPSLFLDFLRLATRIRNLDLSFNPRVEVEDRALLLLGGLSELRSLRLRACAVPVLSRLMPHIKVPLTCLGLHQEHLALDPSSDRSPFNPFPFITPFRGSLTHLWLGAYVPISVPPTTPGSQAVVFPRVERLQWHSHSTHDASTFASLFPAVKHLDISLATLLITREEATNFRQRSLDRPQWGAAHKMQQVCGGPLDLWMLGLKCQVERLELTIRDLPQPAFVPDIMLPAVIHDLSPTSLKLNLSAPCSTLGNGQLQAFVHDQLHELEIKISLVDPFLLFVVSIIPPFLERKASQRAAAARWNLRRLRFTFKKVGHTEAEDSWPEHCAQVNWGFLAKMLFTIVPSLCNVSFYVSEYQNLSWRKGQLDDKLDLDSLFLEIGGKPPQIISEIVQQFLHAGPTHFIF